MPSKKELLEAKQILSARLLRAGLRGQVLGRGYTLRVSAAIAAVSQNVHAVGMGEKISDEQPTGVPSIRFYVAQKLAPSLLPPKDRLPESVDGIPTDVIESPPAFILARKTKAKKRTAATASAAKVSTACTRNRKKRQRPIVAGISAAHYQVTAGTIAYFCKSTRVGDDPGRVFVLSNNHVFADVNHGLAGDDLYQPGPADGGTPADHFAELHRYVAIQLGGIVPNRVDAAIGSLLPKVEYRAELCRIGRISETGRATEHMRVRKHGRTSGLTEGIVTDESYDALVGMDHNDPSVVALFEDQMRIERVSPSPWFGLGGDSGSLVVQKESATAVGLYFAGPQSGFYGIANHIQDVLTQLEIQLL